MLFNLLSCSHLFDKYLQPMHHSLCIYLHYHSKVCGIHFPDGQATRENLYPVLFMGYDCRVGGGCSSASRAGRLVNGRLLVQIQAGLSCMLKCP